MPSMAKIGSTADTLGGAPRIEGRRIGVHHVAKRVIDAGESPEQVAAAYDLDIADVYRALAAIGRVAVTKRRSSPSTPAQLRR